MSKQWIVAAAAAFYTLLGTFCYLFHIRPGLPAVGFAGASASMSASGNPASVSVKIENGAILLAGTVREPETHALLFERARSLAGPAGVVDRLQVDTTASNGAVFAELAKLIDHMHYAQWLQPGVTLAGNEVILEGLVQDPLTFADIESYARKVAPQAVISNRILRAEPGSRGLTQAMIDKALFAKRFEFDPGSSTIRPETATLLDRVAPILTGVKHGVRIEVHMNPGGDKAAARKISELRAEAVRQYLIEKGVDPGRIHTEAFGQDRPLTDGATSEGRRRNERVILTLF